MENKHYNFETQISYRLLLKHDCPQIKKLAKQAKSKSQLRRLIRNKFFLDQSMPGMKSLYLALLPHSIDRVNFDHLARMICENFSELK